LRGLPDREVFVAAQLDRRAVVTESIGDFVHVETAWRGEQDTPHHGLLLVAPGAYPRHLRRVVGRLINALEVAVQDNSGEVCLVAWLQSRPR
jgi:hypothetical protein